MMIVPHATKEDLLRLADISTFIHGYMTAMKACDKWCLFEEEHIETLRKAYSLLSDEAAKMRREQEKYKDDLEKELSDEDIPF